MYHALPLLLLALLTACGAAPAPVVTASSPLPGPEIYTQARASVVHIEAGAQVGAGLIIDPRGLVLTAAHVVRDAFTITLTLADDPTPRPATLVGFDATADLALLRLVDPPTEPLRALPLSERPLDAITPGLEVWTLGHPAQQPWTITRGLIARVDPAGQRLITALPVASGSSGGPLLVDRAGQLEVLGIVSRMQTQGFSGQSTALPASVVRERLDALEQGLRRGLEDPRAHIATLADHAPLVHQLMLAQRIEGVAPNDTITDPTDQLTATDVPAPVALTLRTSWRYFFTGAHTFRYRVVHYTEGGETTLHSGPWRQFELADVEASFVHHAVIHVDLPTAGHYAVLVDTDGAVSAVAPFELRHGDTVSAAPSRALTKQPLIHDMVIAEQVTTGDGSPTTITHTFNEFRALTEPLTLTFTTHTRWGHNFVGPHRARWLLVDSLGAVIQSVPEHTFTLESTTDTASHTHAWEVTLPTRGLYFVLCVTDGRITRTLPLWIR